MLPVNNHSVVELKFMQIKEAHNRIRELEQDSGPVSVYIVKSFRATKPYTFKFNPRVQPA